MPALGMGTLGTIVLVLFFSPVLMLVGVGLSSLGEWVGGKRD